MEDLVGRRYGLGRAGVDRGQDLALVGEGVLVVEPALDLVGGGKVLVSDGVGEAVVAPTAIRRSWRTR